MTGFTFFQNYFEAISDEENELSEAEQGRLYNAIFAYMFRDEEPNLKGACRMAFNLIKPSLDLSKVRSNAKNKNQNSEEKNQTEIKSNQNQTKIEQVETKSDLSPFFENKEERIKKENKEKEDISSVVHNACACEGEEMAAEYLSFMREHPTVSNDLTNPSLIAAVDYSILSAKIAESKFLQGRNSLSWLIKNYRKILLDSYKDYKPPVSPEAITSGKGDLQLWREFSRARERAKEERGNYPLYRMADEEAKQEMGELYKGLSPEIQAYFDPPSFLELCQMDDEELKFERARFLKALGGIRVRLAKETNHG